MLHYGEDLKNKHEDIDKCTQDRVLHMRNSAAYSTHCLRFEANAIHGWRSCAQQKRRKGSSHFIQRLLEGRSSLEPPISEARLCQVESRHMVTRCSQVSGPRLATWPAHIHFLSKCRSPQCRTPARTAQFKDLWVALCIHPNHSSSGCRPSPTIFRNIDRRAVSSCRNSSTLGAHDSQHHVAQLPTVESNKRSRWLMDDFRFSNKTFKLQNNLQPAAILFWISSLLTSSRLRTVPSRTKLSPVDRTSTEKPSSMEVSPQRCASSKFVWTLHFDECRARPRVFKAYSLK